MDAIERSKEVRPGASPTERFDAWFTRSIDKLKELPEGDGAFAAMMIALPLYERYIVATLKLAGRSTSPESVAMEMGDDLNLNHTQRQIFWAMFRAGFMHQAMTKAGKTQWLVSDRFGEIPEFRTVHGQSCLCLDPWKFADRVIRKFQDDSRLITASESFPLADVFALPGNVFFPSLEGG